MTAKDTGILQEVFSVSATPSLRSVIAAQVALIGMGRAEAMPQAEEDRLFNAQIELIDKALNTELARLDQAIPPKNDK